MKKALVSSEKWVKKMVGNAKFYGLGGWPYLDQLAHAVLRGVKVHIIIGNKKPNWTLEETAQIIGEKVRQLYEASTPKSPKVQGGDINDHLCKFLHVAPFTRARHAEFPKGMRAPAQFYQKTIGDFSANHSKLVVVDKEAFYVGSQNLYYSALPEFGLFVDDIETTTKLLARYWSPLWSYAKKHAVTGGLSGADCVFKGGGAGGEAGAKALLQRALQLAAQPIPQAAPPPPAVPPPAVPAPAQLPAQRVLPPAVVAPQPPQ